MTLGENHDNQAFSTHDRDHDARFYDNCAEHYHGAWWFRSCFQSHLNGKYYTKVFEFSQLNSIESIESVENYC